MSTLKRLLALSGFTVLVFVLACGGNIPASAATAPSAGAAHPATAATTGAATPSRTALLGASPVAVVLGLAHTCALTSAGQVACWGDNSYGQLGTGAHTDARVWTDVQGLPDRITSISAGGYHTCALTAGGAVACWGANGKGELGQSASYESAVPTLVEALTGPVTAISAGGAHTCAIMADRTVACWGDNTYGQLGNGTKTNSRIPALVRGLKGASAIGAGSTHTCAVADSAVWCWGNNIQGQLGDGSTNDSATPVKVTALDAARAVSAGGMHTCALLGGGAVECWGFNEHGQLGDKTDVSRTTPVAVAELGPATAITAGALHTCALLENGAVSCWGFNRKGELGDGANGDRLVPAPAVTSLGRAVAIGAGGAHTCAVASTVACWGQNLYYQLGDGTSENSNLPVTID